MTEKLTPEEIKKALDDRMYCGKWIGKGFLDKKDFQILKNALDLINRQQAEIGRLTTLSELGKMRANDYRVMRDRALKAEAEIERLKAGVNVELENYASEYDSKIKAEAIKEFAERLKKEKYSVCAGHGMSECVVSVYDINNLVKEMVGK